MCVGRLCCQSIEDIKNYTNKVWNYEFDPGDGNPEYLSNAFVEVMAEFERNYHDELEPLYQSMYDVHGIIEIEKTGLPRASEILDTLNENNFGYVDFIGHGRPESVSISKKLNDGGYRQLFSCGDGYDCLNAWNNKGYPNWTHSISCTLMPFRDLSEDPYNSEFNRQYTFVESYLMGGDYGGVVFFGNTGAGHVTGSDLIQKGFFQLLKEDRENIRPTIAGEIFVKNRQNKPGLKWNNYSYHLKYNISGDPLVHIWNDMPQPIQGNYVMDPNRPLFPEEMIFTEVDINSPSNAYRIYDDGSKSKIKWTAENTVQLFYASNYIPLLSDCVFHGITLNSHAYLITGELTLGGEKSWSKLIFGTEADYVFECHGGITLNENVVFMEGARVRLVSKEYVDLCDVKIPKNVKLTIEAPTIVKSRNTEFDENADINFIY